MELGEDWERGYVDTFMLFSCHEFIHSHIPCCLSLQANWVELRAADGSVVVVYNKQTGEVRWVWPKDK